jgi:hypothetical protein
LTTDELARDYTALQEAYVIGTAGSQPFVSGGSFSSGTYDYWNETLIF